MLDKFSKIVVLSVVMPMLLSSCFTVNHYKLGKRYREDVKRYESLKKDHAPEQNIQALDYVREYLGIAKKANRRWDNSRARLYLEMAEEYMDNIENAPEIPPGLMEIYENTTPEVPDAE